MRCINPRPAGFDRDGNITSSERKHHPELLGWMLPCRKCLPCRLNTAREKALRAWHHSQLFDNNIFLTLTYDDEHLESPRLIYPHFQTFMKDLRNHLGNDPNHRISCMVTGEYGDKKQRPHWHALIFNYEPSDPKHKYTSELGHRVFNSATLRELWPRGESEFGALTIDSANYVARYAAKKLTHGNDQDHDFHPIHKTSSKNAIGKPWIEQHWKQTFDLGYCYLPNGQKTSIPRYYVDWLKKNHFMEYVRYVTGVREKIIQQSIEQNRKEEIHYLSQSLNVQGFLYPISRSKVKETILKSKFKRLQEHLKL